MTTPDDNKIIYTKTIGGTSYSLCAIRVHTLDEMVTISQSGWLQGTIDLPFDNALGIVGFSVTGTYCSYCTIADLTIIGADKNQVRYMIRNRATSGGSQTWTLHVNVLYYNASAYTVANTYVNENDYVVSTDKYERGSAMGLDYLGTNQLRIYEGSYTFTPNAYHHTTIDLPMECPLGIISRDFGEASMLGVYEAMAQITPTGSKLALGVRTYLGTPYTSYTLNYRVLYLANPYDTDEIYTSN